MVARAAVCGFCKKIPAFFAKTTITPLGASGLVDVIYCNNAGCGAIIGTSAPNLDERLADIERKLALIERR